MSDKEEKPKKKTLVLTFKGSDQFEVKSATNSSEYPPRSIQSKAVVDILCEDDEWTVRIV